MSDNKRNIDDEYESFMAYLRGETTSPEAGASASSPSAEPSELGIDDEDDAFNVIDAVKEFGQLSGPRSRKPAQPELSRPSEKAARAASDPAGAPSEQPKRGAVQPSHSSDRQSAAETGIFAGLDSFDAEHGAEADDEPVRQYQPSHRQPKFGPEKYNTVVAAGDDGEYLKAWRSIPEEGSAKPKRQAVLPVYEDESGGGNFITRRKNRRKRTRFKLLKSLVWLTACLLVSVVLAIFLIQSCGDVFGYESGSEDIPFVISASDDLSSIADRLSDSGLIKQKLTFKFYAKFKKTTDGFTPGTYSLNPDMSYDEILALTRQTASEEKKIVKITFREGLTVYEIADLLAENGVCDRQEFLDTLQNEDLGFAFIDSIPKDSLRFSRLEGYLFPDTYDFYVGEKTSSVAKKFLNNFNNKITASMYKKMEEQGITLDQLVTLASIVQKEAGRAKEMYRVASVFRNRLNSNDFPLLQSDTTTNYINDYIKPNGGSQEMINAYDTYSVYGLPAGPICCPGIDALRAALSPAETPYFFFLSDEKGTYYYAETYAGHQKNAATAASVGQGEVHGIGMDNRSGQ